MEEDADYDDTYRLYQLYVDSAWPGAKLDTCTGFIVCCRSAEEALNTDPSGMKLVDMHSPLMWPGPDAIQYVHVMCIGTPSRELLYRIRVTRDIGNPRFDPANICAVIMTETASN